MILSFSMVFPRLGDWPDEQKSVETRLKYKLPGNLYSLDRLYDFVTLFSLCLFHLTLWGQVLSANFSNLQLGPSILKVVLMEEIPPGMYETRGK